MDPEVMQWNGTAYVPKAAFDGLTTELASVTSDRDYHRNAAIQQSIHWRNVYQDRLRNAESIIGDISGDIGIFTDEMRQRILAFIAASQSAKGAERG